MTLRETSTDYARPWRPWPIRLANRIVPDVSLDPDALRTAASRAEDLDDFGPPDLRGLYRLCASLEDEADLHPVGRFIQRQRLVGMLRNRLRAVAWTGARADVVAPVVITGLQRTGTTFLHRLLAADPRLRALASWEALNPVPFSDGRDRLREAQRAARALAWMAPDFNAVHPVEPESPEEEVMLLDQSFLSTVPEATLHVPGFATWLERQDVTGSYLYLVQILEILGAARPGRWLLKTPHHLEFLDTLFTVFPDATVVWTHREPLASTASFLSMVAHAEGLCSDAVDPHHIGRHWLRKRCRMVERGLAARSGRRVLDVDYQTLIDDPMATVRRVQAFAGLRPGAEEEVRAVVDGHRRHRHGRHRYRLEDFGLVDDDVRQAYDEVGYVHE